jgi:hypothetical protein
LTFANRITRGLRAALPDFHSLAIEAFLEKYGG